ncbi:hypothetical protein DAPPUDRAFT_114280 [Daphnia pulex]|uniref:Uncharacterized protein n=1 Tax=Daphnia pulex TaxID=6669 RepID=E9HHN1_DAPPU|nr:hypothetical protein DAPPUDRAFT_114280 [Daphnia pulex]|eukprot:EFX68734.1 hypothetical protein DAPPUDRAFT_114280 [Daphnia pulex]
MEKYQELACYVSGDALKLLHDFVKTNQTMLNMNGYVQFLMPPFESMGSGLASYRVLTISLKDEKGSHYSSLSDIIYMANGDIRNNYDKITIVASKFSSITCIPANLASTDIIFFMCGFETKDGNNSFTPYSITGEEMLHGFQSRQLKLNCFARTFIDGLSPGRNCTKMLEQFLSPEEGYANYKKTTDQLARELTGIPDEEMQPITKFLKTAVEYSPENYLKNDFDLVDGEPHVNDDVNFLLEEKMHIEVMGAPKDEVARNARRGIGQPAAPVNESENLEPEMHIEIMVSPEDELKTCLMKNMLETGWLGKKNDGV